jgi:carboxymethylenebutenolidase
MQSYQISNEFIELPVEDGTRMRAYVARPKASGPLPGILVMQEAFGVNSHIRDVTDRLAKEGYVAIAPELFHRTAPGFEDDYSNFQAVMPHMKALTIPGEEADARAAHGWFQSQPDVDQSKLFSIGFCMGGRISVLANTILPLRASVSFYGGSIVAELLDRLPQMHSRVLFFWGGLDKHIPAEQRQTILDKLRANKKSYVNVEFSDADHGFFCDQRASYQPQAAKQAWTLMLEFLRS